MDVILLEFSEASLLYRQVLTNLFSEKHFVKMGKVSIDLRNGIVC